MDQGLNTYSSAFIVSQELPKRLADPAVWHAQHG